MVPTVVDTPGAQIWSVYISEAEKYDKALIDRWRGNMNGMLIFAGLFSAILTAFIIESYKTLQPDWTGACIAQVAAQQAANATGSLPLPIGITLPCEKFSMSLAGSLPTPASSLVCNILWFISLGLSLTSALTATLVEQWAREFLHWTDRLPSPIKRARIFAFLYYGLQRFHMHAFVDVIPLLLHMSLLFFFGGLVAFLFPVNQTVAYLAAGLLGIIVILYGFMTAAPLRLLDCPYKTPLSNILWNVRRYFLHQFKSNTEPQSLHLRSMVNAMIEEATVRSDAREARDKRALAWTMKSLTDDDQLESFVEGIPDMIWGPEGRRRKYDSLIRSLLHDPQVSLGSRIEHLMLSCESGLLEPMVKTRRQILCLRAIWCLGMMSEKGKDRDLLKDPDPLEPPPPDPLQPLNFFQSLRVLPLKTEVTSRYLPSIAALADWNNLCSLHGHVKKITASLQNSEVAFREGRLPDLYKLRLELEEFLAERRRCKWAYLIPTSYSGRNLDELLKEIKALSGKTEPLTPQASSDWVQRVSQIFTIIPTSFNSVQYRVLLSFLQQCTDLDRPAYGFDLVVQTLQADLEPVDVPVGLVVATLGDNVQKAIQLKNPSITHNDIILSTVLPWVDKAHGLSGEIAQRVNHSGMEYLNNRDSNEAICRALRDSNLTSVWERLTRGLETCGPELRGDYSKAMWHLASLFPGLSTPLDAQLSHWPNFTPSTLSVAPAPPYSASVIALLKTHILNAYDKAYVAKELSSHLQDLETLIKANPRPSVAGNNALIAAVRRIEVDWGLITAVCSLLLQFPTMGTRPLQLLAPFPTYTIQTYHAYTEWREQALAAVGTVTELLPRLDRRMEEARFAITSEFLQACSADAPELPYNAVETFESLSANLFVSRPAHRDNQEGFAVAISSLADTADITPDHSRLLNATINSPLFNDPQLPWLDNPTALSKMKRAVQMLQEHLNVGVEDGLTNRKLDDIGSWLEAKPLPLEPLGVELH
ncbi:hypothetical protein MVEN_02618600 [Mycena venus]|uniref:DUF6535 domain-containing protein n=1 Tax=Mycena venus TaxID=2733690 RepID=A0A8H6WU10_9AGAR|nr:hypothetical protein MVEN_02618600 [Mycena venus]